MAWMRGCLLLVLCVMIGPEPSRAVVDENADADDARRIARLIEQLGDPEFQKREQASKELAALGQAAAVALSEARVSQQDPEIRLRVRRLLSALNSRSPEAAAFAKKLIRVLDILDEECLWQPNQETCAREVVRTLCERASLKVPTSLTRRLRKAKKMSREQLRDLFRDTYVCTASLTKRSLKQLSEETIQRMMATCDPYAELIPEERLARWSLEPVSRPAGVGLRLEVDSESKLIRVITPVRGSPAHRAGVRAGDLLTHITLTTDKEGKRLAPARVISTRGMSVKAVNDKLLGRAGTRVQLTLRRASIAKPLQLEMERDSVFPDTVLGWRLKKDDTWDYWLDARNKIAYIRLTRFARRSHADLKETITNLRRQRMKGLVLDLRFNPGGLLTQAIEIADLFIKDGTIVSACDRSGRKRAFTGTAKGSLLDFPIVCLVNGESALSSELVSGCLQDHHRALIVGERSYGRGCVQNIQDFGRGQLKYTTAQFLRPCGKKLERTPVPGFPDADWGVIPDRGYVLKLPTRERTRLKDYLDSREYLIRRDRPVRDAFATFADRQRDRALTYLRERLGKPQNPGAGNDKKS